MFYELTIALRTIRQEGFKPLLEKISLYFRQLGWGLQFLNLPLPHGKPPEEVLHFCFDTAGDLIGPSQIHSEILALARLVKERKPKVVVEIGTAKGGTLCILCCVAEPTATVISIDLPGGVHGGGYPRWRSIIYRRFAQPKQSLHLLRLDSHLTSTLDQLKAVLPAGGIDLLFLDGDHTYAGVKQDFEMYSPLVRRGGLVVFHDICVHPPEYNCQVDEYWQEVRKQYKSWEYVENPKQGMYGIGVVELA